MLRSVNSLPGGIQIKASSERIVYDFLATEAAQHATPNIPTLRIKYFMPHPIDGTQPLVAAMIHNSCIGFAALPEYVAFASLRTLCNSWATTRRMAHGAEGCRFGFAFVGGDDILHYVTCPLILLAAAQLGLAPPWLRGGAPDFHLLFLARDAARSDVLSAICWQCILYSLFNTAKGDRRPISSGQFAPALRAHCRALWARSSACRVPLLWP